MDDPTRDADGSACADQLFEHPGGAFVRELTHEVLSFLERRAIPYAEQLVDGGSDPSDVVFLTIETLRSIADGLELGAVSG